MITPSGPAAHAVDLVKRYGDRIAVDHLTFEIAPGQCFGLLGPNGAGKSTTMRMLCCLTSRDGGALSVLGLDPETHPRQLKQRLGVVAQDINLDLELTVRENLLVYARYFGIPRAAAHARADELLAFVQLTDRAEDAVERLSGGMQRRLQIARALINDPELVLLDEPTTGLDPQARRVVWERLRELRERGVTLILSTHYMDEAEQLCDRIVIVDEGHIIRDGTPQDLIRNEVGREILALRVDSMLRDHILGQVPPESILDDAEGRLELACENAEVLHESLRAAGVTAELIGVRRASLEDVFLRITGRRLRDD